MSSRDNFGTGLCAHCGGSGQLFDARVGDIECHECDGCGHFGADGEPTPRDQEKYAGSPSYQPEEHPQ